MPPRSDVTMARNNQPKREPLREEDEPQTTIHENWRKHYTTNEGE
jgi:hypothetical protein